MRIFKDKIGLTVKNDGKALTAKLGLEHGTLRHEGDFVFRAVYGGTSVIIRTEPKDDEGNEIIITSVSAVDDADAEFSIMED